MWRSALELLATSQEIVCLKLQERTKSLETGLRFYSNSFVCRPSGQVVTGARGTLSFEIVQVVVHESLRPADLVALGSSLPGTVTQPLSSLSPSEA